MAVFTKYDVLVESFKPADDSDFYGDIEEDIAKLESRIEHDIGSTIGANESPIDPSVLSRADEELYKIIKHFKKTLSVPWVAVSGQHVYYLVPISKLNRSSRTE